MSIQPTPEDMLLDPHGYLAAAEAKGRLVSIQLLSSALAGLCRRVIAAEEALAQLRTPKAAPVNGKTLTARQYEVLEYIRDYIAAHSYPPTIREICQAFGWCGNNACMSHLKPLQKKGYLTWQPGKGRTIQLVNGG